MRLDRFLQVSRLVRRRTLADRLCTHHRVRVNDHVAKASTRVRVGDVIEVDFGGRRVVARVLKVPEDPRARDAGFVEVLERGPSEEA
ncbi:MAG: S4 domain-containing protein [Armatimonadota bacterium]|nr:S4 domain-containing protein [Armatimonadota bacterium]MDW8156352.1 S4 domain-containing protein [Armatimonadota bacterium]